MEDTHVDLCTVAIILFGISVSLHEPQPDGRREASNNSEKTLVAFNVRSPATLLSTSVM